MSPPPPPLVSCFDSQLDPLLLRCHDVKRFQFIFSSINSIFPPGPGSFFLLEGERGTHLVTTKRKCRSEEGDCWTRESKEKR
jgi:hypothetical protein